MSSPESNMSAAAIEHVGKPPEIDKIQMEGLNELFAKSSSTAKSDDLVACGLIPSCQIEATKSVPEQMPPPGPGIAQSEATNFGGIMMEKYLEGEKRNQESNENQEPKETNDSTQGAGGSDRKKPCINEKPTSSGVGDGSAQKIKRCEKPNSSLTGDKIMSPLPDPNNDDSGHVLYDADGQPYSIDFDGKDPMKGDPDEKRVIWPGLPPFSLPSTGIPGSFLDKERQHIGQGRN